MGTFNQKRLLVKDKVILIILSYLLGMFGVDRMYLGCWVSGFFKLITFGGLGIWYLIDLLMIIVNAYNFSEAPAICGGYVWNKGTMEIAHYIATIILILFVIKIIVSFVLWMNSAGKTEERGHKRRHNRENFAESENPENPKHPKHPPGQQECGPGDLPNPSCWVSDNR